MLVGLRLSLLSRIKKKRRAFIFIFFFPTTSNQARTRVSNYTVFDIGGSVRFREEETRKICVILVVLWEDYLDAVLDKEELFYVFHEPLQRARMTRMAEAYVILYKDPATVSYDPYLG